MSATVERLPTTRKFKYRAWCEECQEGLQGGVIPVRNWAYLHNANHHQGEGNA